MKGKRKHHPNRVGGEGGGKGESRTGKISQNTKKKKRSGKYAINQDSGRGPLRSCKNKREKSRKGTWPVVLTTIKGEVV